MKIEIYQAGYNRAAACSSKTRRTRAVTTETMLLCFSVFTKRKKSKPTKIITQYLLPLHMLPKDLYIKLQESRESVLQTNRGIISGYWREMYLKKNQEQLSG